MSWEEKWNINRKTLREPLFEVMGMKKLRADMDHIVPSVWRSLWLQKLLPFVSWVKQVLKGMHFESVTNIQWCVMMILKQVSVEAFQKCYENRKKYRNQCVAVQGE